MFRTFEEFNWFKKEPVIKSNPYKDIDPYGEEDWNDEEQKKLEKIKNRLYIDEETNNVYLDRENDNLIFFGFFRNYPPHELFGFNLHIGFKIKIYKRLNYSSNNIKILTRLLPLRFFEFEVIKRDVDEKIFDKIIKIIEN